MSPQTCLHCGKPFERQRASGKPQVHCSDKCRRAFATQAMNARRRATRPTSCAECGAPLAQPERGRPRRFCSDKCKQRAGNRRQNRARLPLQEGRQRTCVFCGQQFSAKRINRVYCYEGWCGQQAYRQRKLSGALGTVVAHEVTCDECGKTFTAQHPSARWCSKLCANRHWGRVRSRHRRLLSSVAYTDREIFERDGWRCHLCHKPIKRKASRTDPDGATIDHIVPISLGGSDEPSNVASAHSRCNLDKRAKAMNDQLRLV